MFFSPFAAPACAVCSWAVSSACSFWVSVRLAWAVARASLLAALSVIAAFNCSFRAAISEACALSDSALAAATCSWAVANCASKSSMRLASAICSPKLGPEGCFWEASFSRDSAWRLSNSFESILIVSFCFCNSRAWLSNCICCSSTSSGDDLANLFSMSSSSSRFSLLNAICWFMEGGALAFGSSSTSTSPSRPRRVFCWILIACENLAFSCSKPLSSAYILSILLCRDSFSNCWILNFSLNWRCAVCILSFRLPCPSDFS